MAASEKRTDAQGAQQGSEQLPTADGTPAAPGEAGAGGAAAEDKAAGKRKRRGGRFRAGRTRGSRMFTLRTLTALLFIVVVAVGLVLHTGTGSPSVFGVGSIAAICPLGALEVMLASKTVISPVLLGLAIVLVLVVLFGKSFCAWVCPTNLVKRIFGLKQRERAKSESPLDVEAPKRGGVGDARNWVLGASLIAAAACGAPVFCLICPVGLTVATFIAIWRLFALSETTLSLIVFPAILILEIVVLRKWCQNLCPLGAFMSLVARLNRTFRPHSDAKKCIYESKGVACHACSDACPEGIDLHRAQQSAPLNECTRCHACSDACPAHAINFPLLSKQIAAEKKAKKEECGVEG